MNIDTLLASLTEDEKEELIAKLTKIEIKKEPAFPVPKGIQFSIGRNNTKGLSVFAGAQPFGANPVFSFKDEALADEVCDYINDNFWLIRKAIEFSLLDTEGIRDNFVYYNKDMKKWVSYRTPVSATTDILLSDTSLETFKDWLIEHAPEGVLLYEY